MCEMYHRIFVGRDILLHFFDSGGSDLPCFEECVHQFSNCKHTVCVCVYVRACMHARACACVCMCVRACVCKCVYTLQYMYYV